MDKDELPTYVLALCKASRRVFHSEEVDLYELDDVSPLAFTENRPRAALPVRFHGWGAEVDVPGTGERSLIVNVLDRPWLQALTDGHTLSSSADDWGRLRVVVPDGVTRVEVQCNMGWGRGVLGGAGLAALTLGGCFAYRKRFSYNL
jgi:hypothetical protein